MLSFNSIVQWGADVAAGLIDPNNVASALVGLGIASPPLFMAYLKIRANQKKQLHEIRNRNLLDDYCPVVKTSYDKTPEYFFEQKIRSAVPGGSINLREIFKTHTDTHVSYIHQAAQLAYKSDDPIIFNHLRAVIPPELYKSVMYDICVDMKSYFGPLLKGQQDTYGEFAYPILVAERSAQRKQIRIFITAEDQIDVDALPTQDKLLLEVGPREFERKPEHDNNAHLATRRHIAEQLTANQTLRRQTFVSVEP